MSSTSFDTMSGSSRKSSARSELTNPLSTLDLNSGTVYDGLRTDDEDLAADPTRSSEMREQALSTTSWTIEEDELLFGLRKKHLTFEDIQLYLPSKSQEELRTRWETFLENGNIASIAAKWKDLKEEWSMYVAKLWAEKEAEKRLETEGLNLAHLVMMDRNHVEKAYPELLELYDHFFAPGFDERPRPEPLDFRVAAGAKSQGTGKDGDENLDIADAAVPRSLKL